MRMLGPNTNRIKTKKKKVKITSPFMKSDMRFNKSCGRFSYSLNKVAMPLQFNHVMNQSFILPFDFICSPFISFLSKLFSTVYKELCGFRNRLWSFMFKQCHNFVSSVSLCSKDKRLGQ